MFERAFDGGPGMCAAGHVLHGRAVLVGWHPCACAGAAAGGHRTWTCTVCLESGAGAEATLYDGRHDPAGSATARGPEL